MKKILSKIILTSICFFVSISTFVRGDLVLHVPTPSGQDDIIVTGSPNINTDRTELLDIINIINKYLWFALGLLAMIIFVYAGILLMIKGNKDTMKKANNMLLYSGIAILVSMLSYTIINLLINLF